MTDQPGNDPFAQRPADASSTPPSGYGAQPQGYGAPGGYGAPQGFGGQQGYGGQPPYNTLAIVGFVLAFVFALAGLVVGIIARGQIRKTGERGSGLALAAIIISAVQIALGVLAVLAVVLFAASGVDSTSLGTSVLRLG